MTLLGKILQDNFKKCKNKKECKSFVGEKVVFTSKLKKTLGSGIIFEANDTNLKIFLLKGKLSIWSNIKVSYNSNLKKFIEQTKYACIY